MQYLPGNSCEICSGDQRILVTCKMCGAHVCAGCMKQEEEICLNCHESKCTICGEYLSSRACNICGRLVCEDHGTKVDEATICDSCRKREV